ncbi:DNA-binding protein [Alcaligenes faecalis]|nr:DNA-binding protein [Alcaligenes faecalis]
MRLTSFGKTVREARREMGDTLMTMAKALDTSPAFLSAIETGRNKVPADFVEKIYRFFEKKGKALPNLKQLAMASNETAPLDGLSYQHKMLMAGFASSDLNKEQLDRFAELLREINPSLQTNDEQG